MAVDFNGINQNRVGGSQVRDSRESRESREPLGKKQVVEGESSASTTQSNTKGESVSFSSQAKNLSQLESEVKSLPEVDESRVAEIRAKVESGQYQVNADNLAQKMLNMEKTGN